MEPSHRYLGLLICAHTGMKGNGRGPEEGRKVEEVDDGAEDLACGETIPYPIILIKKEKGLTHAYAQ